MEALALCRILEALAEPNRLRIAAALGLEEKCASQLLEAVPVGQPTLSHHMKVLTECGLALARREGRRTLYRLDAPLLARLSRELGGLAAAGAAAPAAPAYFPPRGAKARPKRPLPGAPCPFRTQSPVIWAANFVLSALYLFLPLWYSCGEKKGSSLQLCCCTAASIRQGFPSARGCYKKQDFFR